MDGVDPSAQKKAAREAEKAANSTADRVETVVDAYVKSYLAKKAKPSWAKEAERLLRVEVLPKQRTMALHGEQQLVVLAHYTDGTVQDVTRSALS